MSAEIKKEIQLEIAHVLFIDIVGYSKLSINDQRAAIDELTQAVRASEQFQNAEAASRLIKIPTGDGMALVFYKSPEEPVECALEITRALNEHRQLRMGVHSGPVSGVIDVNGHANLAGAGLNMAQRVMACADAGHILLSKRVADDLGEYEHWRPLLHDLGECEVKHGMRVSIVNLHADEVGNAQLPKKFQALKKHRARMRWTAMTAALVALAAIVAGIAIFSRYRVRSTLAAPEKSIAVLPFENLSDDKQNSYFTDGVQDEILANLARVADLKVISRTSVMLYKSGNPRNLREIGQQLGVAHVLEGSVQRSANRVRLTAQLVDARTDAHLWAETYDRDLADVFAIQSEIAKTIADHLQARLSPTEKIAIEQRPTSDLAAFELYSRAVVLIDAVPLSQSPNENFPQAVTLLGQAIERDPAFALAYYQLAHAHDLLYSLDHVPARLAAAEAAIQSLIRLRPNSGEEHLARAKHYYIVYRNYDHAREELKLAQKSLPNDPLPFLLAGFIDRRQSRWDESNKNLLRAIELDPQNRATTALQQIALSYECLRRYADAEKALDRVVALVPKNPAMRTSRTEIELHWHADPRPLISMIRAILAEDSREAGIIAGSWLQVSLCQRDFDGAERALAALPIDGCNQETIPFPRSWCEGVVARMRGDSTGARAAFANARNEMAKLLREQPAYAEALCALGMADAVLGNKEDAIREGRRAVELLPVTKDSIGGSLLVQYLALIYAWTGETDLALEQLNVATKLPGYLSYGQLRLHPYWDPLRGDPRFQKIVASLAPKDAGK
jgi:TolB-like protein/class 3 adenylate cyclase/Tfp pilus assembly protein PilF